MKKTKSVSVHAEIGPNGIFYWIVREGGSQAYIHPTGAPITFFGKPSLTLITVAKAMDEWCRTDQNRFRGSNLQKITESIKG